MAFENRVFYFRHNPEGSWNLICPKCFQSVATADDSTELHLANQSHHCHGSRPESMQHIFHATDSQSDRLAGLSV